MSATAVDTAAPAAEFAVLDIKDIETHPKNPRHRVAANPELVASVKEHGLVQPLIVAVTDQPAPGSAGYMLIGGHRRLSALKKARIKQAPCVLRRDLETEAKQLEAMLLENSSREDLTPIEEAEGYQGLLDLKYKQADIARVFGCTPSTVSKRLKLLKLSKSTKARVHKGQMTLDDATALIEFADDPETTKRLESAASRGYDFKWELTRARQNKKANAEVAAQVAELLSSGVSEIKVGDGEPATWSTLNEAAKKIGAQSLDQMKAREPDEHKKCLAFGVTSPTEYSASRLEHYCLKPSTHDGKLTAAEKKRQAEQAAANREREEREQAAAAARKLRVDTIAGGTAQLDDLLRGLLPALITTISADLATSKDYQELIGVPEDDQWRHLSTDRDVTMLAQHLADVAAGETPVRPVLEALLIAIAEDQLVRPHWNYKTAALRASVTPYLALLAGLGHEFTPVDQEHARRLEVTGVDGIQAVATDGANDTEETSA